MHPEARTTATARTIERRWLTLADVKLALILCIGTVVAWFLPRRAWRLPCEALAFVTTHIRRERSYQAAERILVIARGRLQLSAPLRLRQDFSAACHEDLLLVLRQHRPWSHQITARLIGEQHIAKALERGRGAILWRSNFVFGTLVESSALWQAGYGLHHLTRAGHGLSESRLGSRLLNPVLKSVEDRFLEECVLWQDSAPAAMLTLARRLRQNRVVSLRAHDYAQEVLEVPFLDGWLRLASGAAELAQLTGAALLPVFTVRNDAGEFEVHVEAPIAVAQGSDPESFVRDAVCQYVERLEPYVLAYPAQWISWHRQARPREAGEPHAPRRVPGSEHDGTVARA